MVKLQIEYLPVEKLKPYAKNARKHDEIDVEAIEESIEAFDFSDPIGIAGPDNIIVEGHGRLQAAKRLGLKEVPCIRLDHLTKEQQDAYRLAHNKTAELSDWDQTALREEIAELENYNMFDFGFSASDILDFGMDDETESEPEPDEPEKPDSYYGDERDRTFRAYNLFDYDPASIAGPYDLPTLQACAYVPKNLIGFNEVLTAADHSRGVHFFLDDYQFERIWATPEKYIEKLKDFPCVLTPDFSLYADMPRAMKIWNVYRSRLIGQTMQKRGMTVIPTLQYAGEDTLAWCFDGIEGGGTVAVSTVGVMKDAETKRIWSKGMEAALEKVRPKTVVCYGVKPDFDFQGVETVFVQPRKFKD